MYLEINLSLMLVWNNPIHSTSSMAMTSSMLVTTTIWSWSTVKVVTTKSQVDMESCRSISFGVATATTRFGLSIQTKEQQMQQMVQTSDTVE